MRVCTRHKKSPEGLDLLRKRVFGGVARPSRFSVSGAWGWTRIQSCYFHQNWARTLELRQRSWLSFVKHRTFMQIGGSMRPTRVDVITGVQRRSRLKTV